MANGQSDMAIDVRDLCVDFVRRRNVFGRPAERVSALRNVSFGARKSKTLGIIGESGSGKSTLARVLTGLLPPSSGAVNINRELTSQNGQARAQPVQMVFQHPYESLNPKKRVWYSLVEAKIVQGGFSKADLRRDAERIARMVGLAPELLNQYAHQLSGGQRQRVAIGRALAAETQILILDEPTSALDVLVQAQILNLLQELQEEYGLTYLFISHDISVIRHMSDEVIVLFGGEILERGWAHDVLTNPKHDYTKELIASSPRLIDMSSSSGGEQ